MHDMRTMIHQHRRRCRGSYVRANEYGVRRRAGAQLERAAHVGVRDEVELALAVARLHVRQAAELVRQRRERLGEHLPVVDVHRELALLRALGRAARADDVAGVDPVHEVLERLGRVLVRVDDFTFVGIWCFISIWSDLHSVCPF